MECRSATFFADDPVKDVPGVTLSEEEDRFLTQVHRYSAHLTESDPVLLAW